METRSLAESTIQQLVKKVCETGSFSDKKINQRRTVLTEEKLDNIAYLLGKSPNKSLSKLAQQAGVSVSSVYKATKLLNLSTCNANGIHQSTVTELLDKMKKHNASKRLCGDFTMKGATSYFRSKSGVFG
ncbi:hypothetical protein C0J52_12352 [Blattella germanica]|nr:hypothetical protein C0J52_12352 [Blattella germanica]